MCGLEWSSVCMGVLARFLGVLLGGLGNTHTHAGGNVCACVWGGAEHLCVLLRGWKSTPSHLQVEPSKIVLYIRKIVYVHMPSRLILQQNKLESLKLFWKISWQFYSFGVLNPALFLGQSSTIDEWPRGLYFLSIPELSCDCQASPVCLWSFYILVFSELVSSVKSDSLLGGIESLVSVWQKVTVVIRTQRPFLHVTLFCPTSKNT